MGRALRGVVVAMVVVAAVVGGAAGLGEVGTASKEPAHPHAYALIHYEGTELDPEYLLGARVLIASLERVAPAADIVVLVSENVTPETRAVLGATSARLKFVPNIPNPYKRTNAGEGEGAGGGGNGGADESEAASYKAHFEHSLNKLHLWDMTEYERVIYMDEDSICLRNMDELFKCGHFCAAFQNPVNFHTGMLVLKPDRAVYDDMLAALAAGMMSYDGGDQGFFVSYFAELAGAPLFDRTDYADGAVSDAPLMRLDIPYTMNHIYYYEKFSFKLYRSRKYPELLHAAVPAFSMTYPIAQSFKPWNWVPYWYMDIHWVWLSVRRTLGDETPVEDCARFVASTLVPYAAYTWAVGRWGSAVFGPGSLVWTTVRPRMAAAVARFSLRVCVWALMPLVWVAAKAAVVLIPSTTYPLSAWSIFVAAHVGYFRIILDVLARTVTGNADGVGLTPVAPIAGLIVVTLYVCMSVRFPEFISKLAFSLVMVLVIGERHNAALGAELAKVCAVAEREKGVDSDDEHV